MKVRLQKDDQGNWTVLVTRTRASEGRTQIVQARSRAELKLAVKDAADKMRGQAPLPGL